MRDKSTVGIACNLQAIRKAKKLSQDDLAALLNIARKTLSFYENGKSFPPIDEAYRIAKVLDVDASQIWTTELANAERGEFYLRQSASVLSMAKTITDPSERYHAELIAQDWLNLAQSITGRPGRIQTAG